jgi:hypothetical protein
MTFASISRVVSQSAISLFCCSLPSQRELLTQICCVVLAVAFFVGESTDGGRDTKMFYCLVFKSKIQLNKGIVRKVL